MGSQKPPGETVDATELVARRTAFGVVYQVTIPAKAIDAQMTAHLAKMAPRISLKGFRPGRVPAFHLRKIFGKQAMAEVIDAAVREANADLSRGRWRVLDEPKVTLPTDEKELTAVMAGTGDLTYTVELEVLPEVVPIDFATIRLERKYTEITDEVVDKALTAIAHLNRPPRAPEATEDPPAAAIDDAFAKTFGAADLEALRAQIRERAEIEAAVASRMRLKRALLDVLVEAHTFPVPPSLVELEFKTVWAAVEGDLREHKTTWEEQGATEAAAREEYTAVAERRVRIGMIITEIGDRNDISVSDAETDAAVADAARRVGPENVQNVIRFYQTNPQGLASLRAPLFEDKVVDFILAQAVVVDMLVSREELLADDQP
jgi:FKBP-type peptidyl-prolyl cis-trans isomerase (trigger factor)